MIEGRKVKRKHDWIPQRRRRFRLSVRVWGCGTFSARSPTPDHLLLIAVGIVAGVGFGVLAGVIRFGIGVLAR